MIPTNAPPPHDCTPTIVPTIAPQRRYPDPPTPPLTYVTPYPLFIRTIIHVEYKRNVFSFFKSTDSFESLQSYVYTCPLLLVALNLL